MSAACRTGEGVGVRRQPMPGSAVQRFFLLRHTEQAPMAGESLLCTRDNHGISQHVAQNISREMKLFSLASQFDFGHSHKYHGADRCVIMAVALT